LGILAACGVGGSGCASAPARVPEPTARTLEAAFDSPHGGELQVRLAFEADVDLDLYVSDPLLETVYYANTPSRTGGALDADARCKGAPALGVRVERVRFETAHPGRYRVGVDYPEGCGGGAEAPFVIRVDVGGQMHTSSGVARRLDFDSRALEFSLDAAGTLGP
jgi:uncharacterized protein YfaP (DUF2135 family)